MPSLFPSRHALPLPYQADISRKEMDAATPTVVTANTKGEAAWEEVAALRAAGVRLIPPGKDAAEVSAQARHDDAVLRRYTLSAVRHYTAVVRAGLLAETHAWRHNASVRLATLLTALGTAKECAQALSLWEQALTTGRLVWPAGGCWPERIPILRGAIKAATVVSTDAVPAFHAAAAARKKQEAAEAIRKAEAAAAASAAATGGGGDYGGGAATLEAKAKRAAEVAAVAAAAAEDEEGGAGSSAGAGAGVGAGSAQLPQVPAAIVEAAAAAKLRAVELVAELELAESTLGLSVGANTAGSSGDGGGGQVEGAAATE